MSAPEIIYEDADMLAVVKPAGLQVHAARHSGKNSPKKDTPTLVDWLMQVRPEIKGVGDDPVFRPGIVHRLDKDTSGVMLVPKNQKTFEYLKNLFQEHAIKKTYLALVVGRPKKDHGTIDAAIGIRNGTMKRSVRSPRMAKSAVTEYRVVKTIEDPDGKAYTTLEVFPKTGRTHQIRVHLASIGHPVVGDRLYGPGKSPVWASRLMLHALSLEFTTQGGKRMKLESEPPAVIHTPLFQELRHMV